MPACTYDFTIEQGASCSVQFIYKSADGLPISLVGYTARMQLRLRKTSPEVMAELSSEAGTILIDEDAGKVTLVFTDETTASISRDGYYDVMLYVGEDAYRFAEGKITLSKGVTRNA